MLDFDHRSDKRFSISTMFKNCHSVEQLRKEIAKCDVRCANCHRKKTALERGYWKVLYSENGPIV